MLFIRFQNFAYARMGWQPTRGTLHNLVLEGNILKTVPKATTPKKNAKAE